MSKQPKIVIIGAGVAGLGAADILARNGFNDITVLEAKDRIGGRIFTLPYGNSYVEMGAQWIHGEANNPLFENAKANNLILTSQEFENVYNCADTRKKLFFTQDGTLIDDSFVQETFSLLDQIYDDANKFYRENLMWNNDADDSMGMYVYDQFYRSVTETSNHELNRLQEGLFNWRMISEKTENGCPSMYEVSLHGWGKFVPCQGNEEVELKYGYRPLLDHLIQSLQPQCIKLNHVVDQIYWNCSSDNRKSTVDFNKSCFPVSVKLINGEVFVADHVIVTCSLGVLKRHAQRMFRPLLPRDKMAAIQLLGYGTVNKLFLEFEKPFWDKNFYSINLVWYDDEPLILSNRESVNEEKENNNQAWYRSIHTFNTVTSQPNVLCGWLAGEEAEYVEMIEDDVVAEVCTELLKRFLGRKDISLPIKVTRSRWYNDPFTRGAYAYVKMGASGSEVGTLARSLPSDKEPQLMFAGEATHDEYFSTTHGALLTGQREAKKILELYNKQT